MSTIFLLLSLLQISPSGEPKFLEWIPLINLVVMFAGAIAAVLILRSALAAYKESVTELKAEFVIFRNDVLNRFERISESTTERFTEIDNRVTELEARHKFEDRQNHIKGDS